MFVKMVPVKQEQKRFHPDEMTATKISLGRQRREERKPMEEGRRLRYEDGRRKMIKAQRSKLKG